MITHADAICAFESLIPEFKTLGLELVSDYVAGTGRFFFVLDPKATIKDAYAHRIFCCTSIEELRAWMSAYKYAKGIA